MERGALWRGWDLHVHTPYSVENHYGGAPDVVWDRYLDELEKLPSHITVLGINDYWTLEGYARLKADKESGRLANIDRLFPVIEMRLDAFGGTTSGFSKINMHAIFDPDLSVDVIQAQFIGALPSRFRLDPMAQEADWNQLIDQASVTELGARIRAAMPDSQPNPPESDYKLGFNSLVLSLKDVTEVTNRTALKGRVLLALGKTEWGDLKWNDQTIATKRTLINEADLLFTAFGDVSSWQDQRAKLVAQNVRDRLVDCSDAHYWSDSLEKDRLGNCWTWIRADPTFAGLRQALLDFDNRVYVGIQPPDLARYSTSPGTVIDRIAVRNRETRTPPFDYELVLNPRLVAVIGNKGQGKSALLDCIARAGNSSRAGFAFLNSSRFLSPKSKRKAGGFDAHLTWLDGTSRVEPLDSDHDSSDLERLEYLPQSFIEQVCSSDPDGEDLDAFERELRAVLFTHISDRDRMGADTFEALMSSATSEIDSRISTKRGEVASLCQELSSLLTESSSVRIQDLKSRRAHLEGQLEAAEVTLREATEALRVIDIERADKPAVDAAELRLQSLSVDRAELVHRQRELSELAAQVATRERRLRHLIIEIDARVRELENLGREVIDLSYLTELADKSVVQIDVDRGILDRAVAEVGRVGASLDAEAKQVAAKIVEIELALAEASENLARIDQARELARREVEHCRTRVETIRGVEADPESLLGIEAMIARHEELPRLIADVKERAIGLSVEILTLSRERLDALSGLYGPARDFVATSKIATRAALSFSAELVVTSAWDQLVGALDLRRAAALANWMYALRKTVDLSEPDVLRSSLESILEQVVRSGSSSTGSQVQPNENLRAATPFAVFSATLLQLEWLELRFGLSGNGLSLRELSPGQRGLILLLFYLVLDKRATPLLLDQPEENLDNETIKETLVPALSESSKRRQIILVTHNANLAIVGSADQIVHCSKDGDFFNVTSGSSVARDLNDLSVNVLEGTWDAFRARHLIYETGASNRT